jgi:hypothetical protein
MVGRGFEAVGGEQAGGQGEREEQKREKMAGAHGRIGGDAQRLTLNAER